MHIAILGAGFTGLAAALRLVQSGHQVTVVEKESSPGGLGGGFQDKSWDWTLERAYHHWFTNDNSALSLAKEIGQKVIVTRPRTDVFIKEETLPFDSPLSLLTFPYLSPINKIRMGLAILNLRYLSNLSDLGSEKALPWLRSWMGEKATALIWEPLFTGKFGNFKDEIALTWFWARIKKRTPSLAYPEGGFQRFADELAREIERSGGKILFNREATSLKSSSHCVNLTLTPRGCKQEFDIVISTLPTPVFTKIAPQLPPAYVQRISSIPHLHALNLILIMKEPFLPSSYWLNITDTSFPFLVLAEHTNFMNPQHYGNQHILYIGNYLPDGHPYLKMSPEQLYKIYEPFLKKINPNYELPASPTQPASQGERGEPTTNYELFTSPFAQPIVTPDYPQLIPEFKTPLKGVYLANMDMVYPWDRGTNYAIELGEKVAKLVDNRN